MITRRNTASRRAPVHKAPARRRTVTRFDRPVTRAERLRAIAQARQEGGVSKTKPASRLIGRYPAETIEYCAAAIGEFASPTVHGAMLLMIVDALKHAETVIREAGAEADFEREDRQ